MSTLRFQEIEHTADWALRVQGKDLKQLFLHAAQGMLSLEGAEAGSGEPTELEIKCSAEDREGLLVAWLEELLYHIEMRSITYTALDIRRLNDHELEAAVVAVPLKVSKQHIKAVTYHELEIIHTAEGFEATVVFDV